MSRKTRVLQKRFAVFCEGDTEYNYIDKMRKNQGVELVLKPINMHNPDFEYVACLHSPQYRGQDSHKFIESVLGAKSIASFKGNADVYNFLNSGELSYQTMIESLRERAKKGGGLRVAWRVAKRGLLI